MRLTLRAEPVIGLHLLRVSAVPSTAAAASGVRSAASVYVAASTRNSWLGTAVARMPSTGKVVLAAFRADPVTVEELRSGRS